MSETVQFHGHEHWQELEITLDRTKSENGSLGFRIAGGNDGLSSKYNFKSIYVSIIHKDGLADKDKQLQLYDIILRVNNEDFRDISCRAALQALRTSENVVQLTVRRLNEDLCEYIELKHQGRLGVSVAGGIGNTYVENDPGIFVTKFCTDSPIGQLEIGDRLIEISSKLNTYDLRFLPFEQAKKCIQLACSESENVRLKIARGKSLEEQSENYEHVDSDDEPLIVPFDIDDYQRYEKRCKLYNEDCVLNLLPQVKVVHRIVTIERIDIEE